MLGGTGTRGVLQTDESVGDKGGNHTTPFGMTWVNNRELGGGGAHVLGTAQETPSGCSPIPLPCTGRSARGEPNGERKRVAVLSRCVALSLKIAEVLIQMSGKPGSNQWFPAFLRVGWK